MINRKFSGPLGRATKFSHPRATMSVIVVMFTAANKFTAFTQSDCWTLGLQTTDGNKTSEAQDRQPEHEQNVADNRAGNRRFDHAAQAFRECNHGND